MPRSHGDLPGALRHIPTGRLWPGRADPPPRFHNGGNLCLDAPSLHRKVGLPEKDYYHIQGHNIEEWHTTVKVKATFKS